MFVSSCAFTCIIVPNSTIHASTTLSRVVRFVRVCELTELGTINLTPSYADNRTAVSLDIEEYSEVFFVSGYRRSNSENHEKKFLFLFVLSLPPFCLCE